jgi:Xaa-Pro dipeptidase
MTKGHNDITSALYTGHIRVLAKRYTDALHSCDAQRAIVFAGVPAVRDRDDQLLPFHADPYFRQWAPLADAAGSIIEFRPGHKPRLVFVTDDDFWHARISPPPDHVQSEFDVVMSTQRNAANALSQHGEQTVIIGNATCDIGQTADSKAFVYFLDYERAVKTEYEIACMRRANAQAVAGHRAVYEIFSNGISEFDLHIRYCQASRQCENELPYPNIIGLNEHAAILHYQHRETLPPDTSRSLLIDAGAQRNGYAADVTRTYALRQDRFSELIDAVDNMQQSICAMVSNGQEFIELNQRCHELLAELLVRFDLISCSAASAIEDGITTTFLPHGLGHLLGLQVHDVGGHSIDHAGNSRRPPKQHPFLRLTRCLETDMVVTIEPGIYFIRSLLDDLNRRRPGVLRHDAIEELLPYGGIRIEDNVRVKSRGQENLTRNAFSD